MSDAPAPSFRGTRIAHRSSLVQDIDDLLEDPDTALHRDVEHLELVRPVSDAHRHLDATTSAHEVEGREVLGEPQRLMQDRHERREVDVDPLGAPEHRGTQDHRGGAVPVLGAVVLSDVHGVESERVGPAGLLDRSLVQIDSRCSDCGCAHVVTQ